MVLRFSYVLRGVFVALATVVVLAMVVTGTPSLLGEFLTALAVLGALFEERWVWDPESRTLVHLSGVVFFTRRKVYPGEQITAFEVRRFVRGSGPWAKKSVGLSFESTGSGLVTIESHRQRKDDDLPVFAGLVAGVLGVPVTEQA